MTEVSVVVAATQLAYDGQPPATLLLTTEPAVSLEVGQTSVLLTVEAPAFELTTPNEQGPKGPPGPQGTPGLQGNPGPAGSSELNPSFILDGGNF